LEKRRWLLKSYKLLKIFYFAGIMCLSRRVVWMNQEK